MAGAQRGGKSAFWSTITDLSLASVATAKDLYVDGINRLSDRTVWLRDEIGRRTAAYASATAGSSGKVTGSIDLGTLTYDDIAGTLNSLTLQVQADAGGVKTTTFGIGAGLAPTSPADVVNAINAAAGGFFAASVDAAGHLSLASTTTGGGSTVNIVGGSAVALLGFVVAQNATGAASGNDGTSQIGGASVVGALLTLPAGTLRAQLQYVADNVGSAVSSLVAGYAGNSIAIGDGNPAHTSLLSTFLHAIADKMARVDVGNAFVGNQDFQGKVTHEMAVYHAPGAYQSRVAGTIVITDAAPTINAGHSLWHLVSTQAAVVATVTNYAGADFPEIDIEWVPSDPTHQLTLIREDATPFLIILGGGFARITHRAGTWRPMFAASCVDGSHVTWTTQA